jgi:transposase, IS5 family
MRRPPHGATDLCGSSLRAIRKSTRRERFLDEMNRVVPWAELVAAIEPVYPKADGPGLHCLQQWFNLSDPAVEEALYDSRAMRHFVGIDLGREPVPDETVNDHLKFPPL